MKTVACMGILLALPLTSCGDDPADFAGDFSVNITNRDNGCNFANWTEGETASNIALTVTQDGNDVTATVEGLVGGYLNLVLGSNVFEGQGDGNHLDLTLYGTRSATEGNCTYTVNANLDAVLSGDLLEGQLHYRAATNGNPDCAALEGCLTYQDLNGARPPQ